MNNDHLQTERHDETPAGRGRTGGRHGRTGGQHRGGSAPRRRATLLAVAAVVTVGGASVVLLRPDSGTDHALAADPSGASAPAATVPDSPTPDTSPSAKPRKPSASPSKAKKHVKRHASPRPKASRTASGTESTKRTAPRTPHVDSGAGANTPSGGQSATGTAAQFAQKVVELVNAQRAQHGCGPLTVDARIQRAAQAHSDDMAARNFYDHITPEGVDPGTRMTKAGYSWGSYAENIFKSPKDPATAVDGWMKSPGHRANILNCSYKETGVGVNMSGNGPWWTQNFGTQR